MASCSRLLQDHLSPRLQFWRRFRDRLFLRRWLPGDQVVAQDVQRRAADAEHERPGERLFSSDRNTERRPAIQAKRFRDVGNNINR